MSQDILYCLHASTQKMSCQQFKTVSCLSKCLVTRHTISDNYQDTSFTQDKILSIMCIKDRLFVPRHQLVSRHFLGVVGRSPTLVRHLPRHIYLSRDNWTKMTILWLYCMSWDKYDGGLRRTLLTRTYELSML